MIFLARYLDALRHSSSICFGLSRSCSQVVGCMGLAIEDNIRSFALQRSLPELSTISHLIWSTGTTLELRRWVTPNPYCGTAMLIVGVELSPGLTIASLQDSRNACSTSLRTIFSLDIDFCLRYVG